MSEGTGVFLLSQKNIPNLYPKQKILNKCFTVMGGKFKFSARDRDLEYFFGTFWHKATFSYQIIYCELAEPEGKGTAISFRAAADDGAARVSVRCRRRAAQ